MTDGARQCGGPLADGERVTYGYIQSIYDAPVTEEFFRDGARLRMSRVRSADIRAVEYFRWDGDIRRDGDDYVQDAPAIVVERLVIRVTPEHDQRIATVAWACELAPSAGAVVTVTPIVRTMLASTTHERSP